MATPTTNRPTPERIFRILGAYQHSEALKAAIDLNVFTAIGEGADTAAALAAKIGAAERGVRSLCDYLTVQELLTKEAGRYALTQETALFLDVRSLACIASMAEFMVSEFNKRTFSALADAVRKGGTTSGEGDNAKPKDEMWVTFARSMVPLAIPAAEFIAQLMGAAQGKECSVLDIAAGHGIYGITLARRNPKAKVVALDWPNVLEVARENAKKFGVAERYSTRPGSAFDADLGEGYDFALLTNIFHHFDKPTCEKLMRRVHAALKPRGRAITVEFVPNEDRVSPPVAAAFSLIMLAGTDAGDAYTLSEYEKMFDNAGFGKTTLHQIPEMPQQVLVTEKAE